MYLKSAKLFFSCYHFSVGLKTWIKLYFMRNFTKLDSLVEVFVNCFQIVKYMGSKYFKIAAYYEEWWPFAHFQKFTCWSVKVNSLQVDMNLSMLVSLKREETKWRADILASGIAALSNLSSRSFRTSVTRYERCCFWDNVHNLVWIFPWNCLSVLNNMFNYDETHTQTKHSQLSIIFTLCFKWR